MITLLKRPASFSEKIPVPQVTGLLERHKISPESHQYWMNWAKKKQINLYFNANCSHGCNYCVSNMQDRVKRNNIVDEIGATEYLKHILRLAGNYKTQYTLSGPGECSEHPAFLEVVRGILDSGHELSTQTHGLTSRRMAETFKPYDRKFLGERVSFGLSFHISAYLDDKNDTRLKAYLEEHYPRLTDIGARITLIIPLSPKALAYKDLENNLDYFRNTAREKGLTFNYNLIELQGVYEGKKYPASFTESERERLEYLFRKYDSLRNNVKAKADDLQAMHGPLYLKGMPCYISTRFIEVLPTGELRHCQASPKMESGAHLTDKNYAIQFSDGPKPCPFEQCLCKAAGMRNALMPLGVQLGDYVEELNRNVASYGKEYERYFYALTGRYKNLKFETADVCWKLPNPSEKVRWQAVSLSKISSKGKVFLENSKEGTVCKLQLKGPGKIRAFPSSLSPIVSVMTRAIFPWFSKSSSSFLLEPGAYTLRIRVTGKGRYVVVGQLYEEGSGWKAVLSRTYMPNATIPYQEEAFFVAGNKKRLFRPVVGLNQPGEITIDRLSVCKIK